jgi:ParB family transcriptional regulator, chromosome partitioning protein
MVKTPERRGLGRGLSALMADMTPEGGFAEAPADSPRKPITTLPVEKIRPNPQQPRRTFAAEALQELSASILQKGVLQPLIVRALPDGDTYQIVAGERRWRAAQMAQVHEVPVLIRAFNDDEVLQVAIIENIQRADLNAIEEAAGYRHLMDRFGHTQEKLAEALSKSRSHIANLLRLLTLPQDVQTHLREGRLTAGHARALITSPNASELARIVIERGLSVRETEQLIRRSKPDAGTRAGGRIPKSFQKDADTRALEGDLSMNLKMGVSINHEPGGESGTLTIRYNSLDDLDLLCRALSVIPRDGSI